MSSSYGLLGSLLFPLFLALSSTPFCLYSFYYVSRFSWYFLVLFVLLGLFLGLFLVVGRFICIRLDFCCSSAQIIYLLVLKL